MRSIVKQDIRGSRLGAAAVWAAVAVMLAGCGGGGGGGGGTSDAGAAPVQSHASPTVSTAGAAAPPSGGTAPATAAPTATAPASGADGSQEQRINSTTAGNQVGAAIVRLRSGGHVVAWNSQASDTSTSICAQRYSADGAAVGTQDCRATGVATTGIKPTVAALDDGGYLIAWVVRDDGSSQTGVRAQRYDANGTPVGDEQKVNARSADDLYPVAAAGLAGGGWVVAWKSTQPASDILVRRFDAAGAPQGEEQRANAFFGRSGGSRHHPAVASLADGGWVVAWSSQFQDDGAVGSAIYVQRFGAAGTPVGSEVRVSDSAQDSVTPALAALANGGWLLTWQAGERVVAQRFNAGGTAQGAATLVDATEAAAECYQRAAPVTCPVTQRTPAATALDDGGYLIAWNAGPGMYLYARRFSAQGSAVGAVTQVADGPAPAAAGTSTGGFMIAWHAWGRDGDMGGIYGRRFGAQALAGTAP